jgi:hypothetical protein
VGSGKSNQEALIGTARELLPFEVQIPTLYNKFEVALHRLSVDFSEQTALHHVERRRDQN